jgi:hypothetical protein
MPTESRADDWHRARDFLLILCDTVHDQRPSTTGAVDRRRRNRKRPVPIPTEDRQRMTAFARLGDGVDQIDDCEPLDRSMCGV